MLNGLLTDSIRTVSSAENEGLATCTPQGVGTLRDSDTKLLARNRGGKDDCNERR